MSIESSKIIKIFDCPMTSISVTAYYDTELMMVFFKPTYKNYASHIEEKVKKTINWCNDNIQHEIVTHGQAVNIVKRISNRKSIQL